jgi:thiamine-phosphate diphosphorylase/hydroxyethylthiazole kinase
MLAAIAGILMFEIAAERAAVRDNVKGPGTFVPAFLDELYTIRKMAEADDTSWLEGVKVNYHGAEGSPKSIKSN